MSYYDKGAMVGWMLDAELRLATGGAKPSKLSNWLFQTPVDAAPAPYIEAPGPQMTLTRAAGGAFISLRVPKEALPVDE